MALEFICSNDIEPDERINIPEGEKGKKANCYRLKSGKIKFFYVNPSAESVKLIPKDIDFISFNIEVNAFNINYGKPIFYDKDAKVLK